MVSTIGAHFTLSKRWGGRFRRNSGGRAIYSEKCDFARWVQLEAQSSMCRRIRRSNTTRHRNATRTARRELWSYRHSGGPHSVARKSDASKRFIRIRAKYFYAIAIDISSERSYNGSSRAADLARRDGIGPKCRRKSTRCKPCYSRDRCEFYTLGAASANRA